MIGQFLLSAQSPVMAGIDDPVDMDIRLI